MNEARRTDLKKAMSLLEEAKSIIESVAGDERAQFDDMSEKAQESDKGEAVDAAASALEDASDTIDELIVSIDGASA